MPDADNPDGLVHNTIEEAVWGDDDLTIRKVGKLGKDTARFGKPWTYTMQSISQ